MISKQTGWSTKSNVLYEIIKQLDRMLSISWKWTQGDFRQNTTSPPPMDETDLRNYGLSSEDIDTRLIYLASIGTILRIIDIRGNLPRTSASDLAVIELTTILDNIILEDL